MVFGYKYYSYVKANLLQLYFLKEALSLQCYMDIHHLRINILIIDLSVDKRLLACNTIWIYYIGNNYKGFYYSFICWEGHVVCRVNLSPYRRTSEFHLTLLVTLCWCWVSTEKASQIGKCCDIPALTWLLVNDESSLIH